MKRSTDEIVKELTEVRMSIVESVNILTEKEVEIEKLRSEMFAKADRQQDLIEEITGIYTKTKSSIQLAPKNEIIH